MPLDSVPESQIPFALRRAKALIDTPEKWCQGTRRNDDGQLCARGAMLVAIRGNTSEPYRLTGPARKYLRLAAKERGYFSEVYLNDGCDHAAVMRMFDLAIALAEQRALHDQAVTRETNSEGCGLWPAIIWSRFGS